MFPEDQRLTLDESGVVGAGCLGGPGLGVAVSYRALPFRTLRPLCAPGPAAQAAGRARPGTPGPSASLAARPRAHRGGRLKLRCPGIVGLVCAPGPAHYRHYPLALGCGPLPTGARAPTRPKRSAAAQRSTAADLSPTP